MRSRFYRETSKAYDIPLETPRLVLRALQRRDDSAIRAFCESDNGAFPHRWYLDFSQTSPGYNSLRHQFSKNFGNDFYLYMFRKGSGHIVGLIELYEDRNGRPRISYFTLPSERGQGYTFEAYRAVFNHGIQQDVFHHLLVAHTDPSNMASQSFLKAAGFKSRGERTIHHPSGDESWPVQFFEKRINHDTQIRHKIPTPR